MKKVQTNICYLCGKPLNAPIDVDHPVMQQLFAPEIRRKHNVSELVTFDVHRACNAAYQSDEDYFVRSLMPFARGSVAGDAIYAKVLEDFRTDRQVPLTTMVLREFDPNPSGLFLPGGKVVKRFDGERLRRVAWKMVRGLYFFHTGEVLPHPWPTVGVQIYAGETPPPDDVLCFVNIAKSRGVYPGVFDYKFEKFPESNDLHYWALLLWDRIIIRVIFHDPTCACDTCTSARSPETEELREVAASNDAPTASAPKFPLKAADFIARGIAEGPALGHVLTLAEDAWLAADFPLDGPTLSAIADQTVARFTRDHRL